jgi:peptide/nickel transport system substrate-binding protein
MSRVIRSALVVAAVAAVVLTLPGLAAAASSSPSPSAAQLRFTVGIGEDIDGVNPFTSWSSITWEAFRLNYNFLTWYDVNYRPTPDLATKWSYSDGGRVWTFTIRSGVKWHDGVPLTARDIAFTYNYIINNSDYTWAYSQYFEHVTKVEAPNDTTLVITSDEPNAGMLALYVPILPEHIWSKIPAKSLETLKSVPTVGSGPFMFDQIKKSKYVSMKANKQYFGGAPTVDEVYFEIYQSPDGLLEDYKAGNLDAAVFETPTYLRSLAGMAGTKTATVDRIGFHELGFNCWTDKKSKGNPLLRDARIRQAVAWAIDKKAIVQQQMFGKAVVGTSVISPAARDWHWNPPADQLVTYNPDKAKEILDAAGYTDRDGDGIREDAAGKKLDFRLAAMSAYNNDIGAAKMISQWLKDVGIKTRLEVVDEGAFGDRVLDNADMDMYIWSWGGDIDPGFQLSCFTTAQILNWSDCQYSNSRYDALYKQQAAAVDRAQRLRIVHQMQQILYQDNPYIVLWYNVDCQAWRTDKWTGYQLVPPATGRPIWTFLRGTYINVRPVAAAATGGGLSGGAIAGIVVGAVAVLGGLGVWIVVRRRRLARAEEA